MSDQPDTQRPSSGADELSSILRDDPALEAIEISPGDHRLRVATLGPINEAELRDRLGAQLNEIQQRFGALESLTLTSDGILESESTGNGTRLSKPTCPTSPKLWTWREIPWPEPDQSEESADEWREMAWFAAVCGVFGLIGFGLSMVAGIPSWIPIVCYSVAMIAGGWDAAIDTFGLLKRGKIDIHFLMLAVALGASLVGAWGEGALLLFLFSFSGALEHFAFYRTKREINALFKAAPKVATVIDPDGTEHIRAVSHIEPGDTLLIRPGDTFPLDATITRGETAADESTLTGEAIPVQKNIGDPVFSGTLNLWGVTRAEVTKRADESSLQQIIRLIQNAQEQKAPAQNFTDKFGSGYTWLALSLTTVMFFIWWLGFGLSPFESSPESYSAFYRAMALLVVISPCALVLSIPSAILAAIAWGARHGILFRGGAAVEKLAQINVVAMDKTGTLTTGDLQVHHVEAFPASAEESLLSLAHGLEKNSTHPVAHALVKFIESRGIEPASIERFQSLTGMGLRGTTDDGDVLIGRRTLLADGPLSDLLDNVPEPPTGFSEVWIITPHSAGRFLLQDQVRHGAGAVLDHLKQSGITPIMLTGDRPEAAAKVAQELDLNPDFIRAGLMPDEKVDAIRQLGADGKKVAMVGDGVNDAPSLAAAYVSVAMGGRASDAALEQSEVVLMNDRIEGFVEALDLSRKARRIIRQNLIISLGTVLLMFLVAMGGDLPLSIGVFAHEGSTALVCLNSLRLLLSKS
ncbi:heavy metal translocating P-type ATPase [Sulfuriroseicoccus oceanibius]|uniref:Cation-translocating P-type ATPase n=1 Tax=Sulfuriroseicoccus oceanibius TaxID=2707525 RepID=A0A6B3L3E2_9BACT|nr:cation-translocating P-type ATPase [Sulfuriroseicoccus oceanibius]QQL45961.1 cation-translocating P-type ATPase [Sulfuriroseicoccus oceanibius]